MPYEQAVRSRAHIERILVVSGMPNAGKSTLLRNMFLDHRFGTKGVVPRQSRVKLVALSEARGLGIRFTSPQENTHDRELEDIFEKIDRCSELAWRAGFYRVNYATPMQPNAVGNLPDLVTICLAIMREFRPERLRVVQIDPRQDGGSGDLLTSQQVAALWGAGCEIVTVSGQRVPGNGRRNWSNGLMLADFFDFT